jgi:hypothetical protein
MGFRQLCFGIFGIHGEGNEVKDGYIIPTTSLAAPFTDCKVPLLGAISAQ